MEVQPNSQNIKGVFDRTVYYIDFYQRQYKWGAEPVNKLLDDIFYKFNKEYDRLKNDNRELKDAICDYGWYYLNTFVTNQIESKTYIVDGQQRLTTLSLILIKLLHMSSERRLPKTLVATVDRLIIGVDEDEQHFWVNHEEQFDTLQDLYDNGIEAEIHDDSITAKNLVANYKVINTFLESHFAKDEGHKFEAFVRYFLNRVVLIKLEVKQTDVPMVFEVINDRGVRLKPYEILKGKLLGQLSKTELDALKLSEKWDNCMNLLGTLDWYSTDERNEFFINYLRSKFSDSQYDGKKIESTTYHRFIMSINQLHLERDPANVVRFMNNEFSYYAKLYWKIRRCKFHEETPYKELYYLSLNGQDRVLMLILSACKLYDEYEEEKIHTVAYEYDRFYSLLQLQKAYSGNDMTEYVYAISKEIREGAVEDIHSAFEKQLITALRRKSGDEGLNECWNYRLFKNTGYDTVDSRFLRYAIARVELFLCKNANISMQHSMKDLVQSKKITFHIEHILSNNESNRALFSDDDTFINERNRLGGLLLLKGKDNQASGNETYTEKLATYAGTLLWNETLRADTYVNNLDFSRWIKENNLNIHPMSSFGLSEIEERQRVLFDIFKLIWR